MARGRQAVQHKEQRVTFLSEPQKAHNHLTRDLVLGRHILDFKRESLGPLQMMARFMDANRRRESLAPFNPGHSRSRFSKSCDFLAFCL